MTIDLKSESFTPGKKNYEHTRAALKERFKQTFDVIVAWNPPGNSFLFFQSVIQLIFMHVSLFL